MLKIITAPDKILSQKAKKINKIDKSLINFIEEMKETLLAAQDPEGVGLAAPQVGKSLSLFIIKLNPKLPIKVFINPKIISRIDYKELSKKRSVHRKTRLEGCLSLPNIWGNVKRESNLSIVYQDESGKKHRKKFTGFIATIIQHEMDHLNGILFTRRVLEQKGDIYKSHKNEQGEDVFEEMEI